MSLEAIFEMSLIAFPQMKIHLHVPVSHFPNYTLLGREHSDRGSDALL